MSDKEKVQLLASEALRLEWLCKNGEPDDAKLEAQLELVANLARDVTCGQYDKRDDQEFFG